MKTLCIIGARGGSKGIPRKNLKMLGGKPLIAWPVHTALAAKMVDRVVVSTEDAEIASVAGKAGAEIIERPAEMATDTAAFDPVLLHVLKTLRDREDYEPDLMVTMESTSPLTIAGDVDGTINLLLERGADTALAAAPVIPFLWRINEDGLAEGVNHDPARRLMRQQIAPQYQETGAVNVMRTAGYLEHKQRYFGRTVLYPIAPGRLIDIDEPKDLIIARALLEALQQDA